MQIFQGGTILILKQLDSSAIGLDPSNIWPTTCIIQTIGLDRSSAHLLYYTVIPTS